MNRSSFRRAEVWRRDRPNRKGRIRPGRRVRVVLTPDERDWLFPSDGTDGRSVEDAGRVRIGRWPTVCHDENGRILEVFDVATYPRLVESRSVIGQLVGRQRRVLPQFDEIMLGHARRQSHKASDQVWYDHLGRRYVGRKRVRD